MTGPKPVQPLEQPAGESTKTAPVPLEPGDLPSSYGRNRLVLLPVDPFLMHVYWDLSSNAPPASGARPILRFHESTSSMDDDLLQSRPFDVDVNLAASRWYVNLWSPDKVYYADLGWQVDDGTFVPLARSNTVRTPRAWPQPPEVATLPVKTVPESPPREIVSEPISAGVVAPPPDERTDTRAELPPLEKHPRPDLAVPFEAAQEIPGEPSRLDTPTPAPAFEVWASGGEETDLTQLNEERFTAGISSARDPLGR